MNYLLVEFRWNSTGYPAASDASNRHQRTVQGGIPNYFDEKYALRVRTRKRCMPSKFD